MSGPVDTTDVDASAQRDPASPPLVIDSRVAQVGALQVRRALPTRGHRTVGAWCFADHFGPAEVTDRFKPDIGPHPHLGLQTVTWLLAGELIHHDSLGSEQPIRPGQLNLMTAGRGVAHSEEGPARYRGPIHGIQLWVAQPSSTRDGPAAFEHHPTLPRLELGNADATILVGELAGAVSSARRDSNHLGVDLALRPGATTVPANTDFEYALLVASGSLDAEDEHIGPGQLLYLGADRDELHLRVAEETRALLLGGLPFPEQLFMWWNFVARSRDEVDAAYDDWAGDTGRFGRVDSTLARMEIAQPVWRTTPS